MNPRIFSPAFAAAFAALCLGAQAAPAVGRPAPDFTLTDIHGQTHSLSEYRGKTVVLEWVNPECPIVHKHYYSGNMPRLQEAAARDGIVWLSINSGGPGRQGDYDNVRAEAWLKRVGSHATDYFRDHDGKVGKLYDARTTPDMSIINPAGVLVYDGASTAFARRIRMTSRGRPTTSRRLSPTSKPAGRCARRIRSPTGAA